MKNIGISSMSFAAVSLALLTACGEGGSGGSDTTNNPVTGNLPPVVSTTVAEVPLVGEVVADCADTGVGIVDSIIDTVNSSAAGSLPTALPTLSEILAQGTSGLPFIGGLVPGTGSQLVPISAQDLLALLPGGVIPSNLPVLGQLPTVCSDLVGLLPASALTDPAALLAALGDPTKLFGLIPVFDGNNDPVGVLLATLPAGLANGGTLPSLPGVSLTQITSMLPLDPTSLPGVGGPLDGLVQTLLGVLGTGGLLTSLPGLSGLGGLLGIL